MDATSKSNASVPFLIPFGMTLATLVIVGGVFFMSKNGFQTKSNAKAAVAILLLVSFSNLGCGTAIGEGAFDKQVEPGPVRLRNVEHLVSFLSNPKKGGESWKRNYKKNREKVADVYWNFQSDGTFVTWIDEYDGKEFPDDDLFAKATGLPASVGCSAIRGKWSADLKSLSLSKMETSTGDKLKDQSIPLAWVDGKLRISINNIQLMRVFPKLTKPDKTVFESFDQNPK